MAEEVVVVVGVADVGAVPVAVGVLGKVPPVFVEGGVEGPNGLFVDGGINTLVDGGGTFGSPSYLMLKPVPGSFLPVTTNGGS